MIIFLHFESGDYMDQLDVKLLQLLQLDARMTVSELSKQLSLSRPSVTERLHRLVEKGIIEGFSARVSPSAVGRDTLLIIQLSDLKVTPQQFGEWVRNETDIIECHQTTGYVGFIIKAAVSGIEGLQKLVDRLIPMGNVHTSVILASPVSYRHIIPVDKTME